MRKENNMPPEDKIKDVAPKSTSSWSPKGPPGIVQPAPVEVGAEEDKKSVSKGKQQIADGETVTQKEVDEVLSSPESEPQKPEKTVSVPEKDLDKLIQKIQDDDTEKKKIAKEKEELMTRIERLESAANKARLFKWDETHKKEKGTVVSLSTYNGKIIIGWKTTRDIVEKTANGVWHEDQRTEIYFADNSPKEEMISRNFWLKTEKIEARVKSLTTDEDGKETYCVITEDGKEYNIGVEFIN